ncbi:MAG: hypothetical protein KGM98_04690 [Bacteroidota bacterium]|nr:hypothetical protein [Bacteroidota bacterium]
MKNILTAVLFTGILIVGDSCIKNPDINCVKTAPKTSCNCSPNADYVCGCDGNTYTNSCFALCAGVPFYTPGKCQP